ncbi:MAG: metallophosphoesterase family protein [Pseudomonadota bacterium]
MKIGVMSDTHLTRVQESLTRIVEECFADVDLILHAGDIVSGEVLDYLESAGVTAVCGNMDGAVAASRLPTKLVLEAGGAVIGLIHGWGAPQGLSRRVRAEFPNKLDCLVFGHSHQPLISEVEGELWFNPGSALAPRGGPGTIGFLHIDEKIWGEIVPIG